MKPNELLGLSDQLALSGYSLSRFLALDDPLKHKDVYFFLNCLKKNPHVLGVDTTDATVKEFLDSEVHAERYNLLFEQLLDHPTMRSYLETWRAMVHLIMGEFSWGKPHITSGATTTSVRGSRPIERFADAQCTAGLDSFLKLNEVPISVPWDSYSIGIGMGVCVPKTALVGRFIGKPCNVNAYYQTSLGKSLNMRLRRRGIDFTYAQDIHRRLARHASIRNHLTTDDQKWASSLIYRSLVKYLVPDDWFKPLDACRDYELSLPGGLRKTLNQFATMGNGFCFELETIIFLGLLYTAASFEGISISDRNIKVFGDDLIYPSKLTERVRAIGRNVGFITNVDKSFSDGPFRESCGGDYFNGHLVRPVYLDRTVTCPFDLTIMANQVWALLLEHGAEELPIMYSVWFKLVSAIYRFHGSSKALWGPSHLQCLHGMPESGWITQCSKWNKVTIRVWETRPLEFTHFKHIVKGLSPEYTMRMVCAGYGRGLGSLMVPEQKLGKRVFGPPKPRTCRYPLVPKAGSDLVPKIVETQLFFEPSLVDPMDPLSVFSILPLTRAPQRLYAPSYSEACKRDKAELYVRLADQLRLAVERKRACLESLGSLVIDV